ncbi:hypothetical protein A4X09_0g3006 [Tilletia walkeri]|uniref:Uncharacterized protein n=1 Tax=Tilletia walkeri TaxID=117179 RepID=A0A8X7T601_9BASI|nr:hypothetical protein A4X09_0g3006 [Tilletia walkeri]
MNYAVVRIHGYGTRQEDGGRLGREAGQSQVVKTKGKARETTAMIRAKGVRTRPARHRIQLMVGTAGTGPRPATNETTWSEFHHCLPSSASMLLLALVLAPVLLPRRVEREQEDAEKKENARLKEEDARLKEESARLKKGSTAAAKGKPKTSDAGLGGESSLGPEGTRGLTRQGEYELISLTFSFLLLQGLMGQGPQASRDKGSLEGREDKARRITEPARASATTPSLETTNTTILLRAVLQDARHLGREGGTVTAEVSSTSTYLLFVLHKSGASTPAGQGRHSGTVRRGGKTITSDLTTKAKVSLINLSLLILTHLEQQAAYGSTANTMRSSVATVRLQTRVVLRGSGRPGQQERSVATGSSKFTPLGRGGKTTVCGASETAERLPQGHQAMYSGGAIQSGR